VAALAVPATFSLLFLLFLVRRLAPGETGAFDQRILRWTMLAFVVHLLIGLVITNSHTAVNYLGTDANQYHQGATQLAQSWMHKELTPHFPAGKEGFYFELAGLYFLFGSHWVAGIVVNAAAAAALVPILTDITRRLFGKDAAQYAAPLVLLIPGLLIWTSQLLREAPVLLLLAAAIDFALRVSERPRAGPVAGLAASLALLFAFRADVAYLLTGGLVIGLVISRRRVLSGLGIGALTLGAAAVLVTSVGLGYKGYQAVSNKDLKHAQLVRSDLSRSATSGIAPTADVSTPAHAIAYLPIGLASFTLGPFPWQVGGLRQVPALLDVSVLWALLPSCWRGFKASRRQRNRRALILAVPAVLITAVLSLVIANFGTIVRERMQTVVLLLPFIALGLSVRAAQRSAQKAEASPIPMGAALLGETRR
jgi:hypothetical protein